VEEKLHLQIFSWCFGMIREKGLFDKVCTSISQDISIGAVECIGNLGRFKK